jgi:hypothetical protein
MATGTVWRSGPSVNESANRNSFHAYMNVSMALVAMPGSASGNMISSAARARLAPSIIAASSRSRGSCRKNAAISQMASGIENVMYGSTRPG